MAKMRWKGGALIAPLPPVMISCGDMEKSNIITVAWTGIINTIPPKTYISVRPSRHSYNIIKESGEFVINLTSASQVRSADYCGIYTGAKVDKFAKCNFHKEEAQGVSCPLIAESPLSLECRVTEIIPLGTHDMFLADIVGVDVDEELIDKNGKLDLSRAHLAAYAHGEYFELGKKIGTFGFSAAKKKKRASAQKGKAHPPKNK
ncbi:MAG: flavin reductase family protein [Ruminococcaceae bacterium]|nr:flavin reductase family protein [Oscillospiraceae bacterium]